MELKPRHIIAYYSFFLKREKFFPENVHTFFFTREAQREREREDMSSSATTQTTTRQTSKGSAHGPSTNSAASACLRLQSDLRSIRIEPPEVRETRQREKHRLALFFPENFEAPVRYFPKREKKKSVFYLTYTRIVLLLTRANPRTLFVDVAHF